MKSILVTGGAGFIGANFVPYFAKKYPEYKVINLDKLTYAGNPDNLSDCAECANYKFVQGDICDRALIEKLFAENDIRGVIHFAAESHVDNSITGPKAFIETNIVGTFTLLDVARNAWMEAPHKFKAGYEDCRFHHSPAGRRPRLVSGRFRRWYRHASRQRQRLQTSCFPGRRCIFAILH